MLRFRKLFPKSACSVIGMIHVGALPGTPKYNGSMKEIIKNTLREAMIYKDCQVDGIIVENMHDVPYVKSKDISSETTAMMTKVCVEIRKVIPESIACGIQILAGCNKEALAVAKAADFNFIRSEGYIFSHIADEGFIDGCSGNLLRYRKHIDAENILIFADIKKKHSSHAITSDISIAETVKAAEFFLADGVILTGSATGDPADLQELNEVKKVAKGPVLIGSGVSIENIDHYKSSDAVIVGTSFKVDGNWENAVSKNKVHDFVTKLKKIQQNC
ncbi:PREDICTED: uncharacterized protein F13E9.13, mitochondrial isoform X2 [Polistes canadensis]|uniref:uncharacterized protein F13E9.13, mitochondrial isoform X2 n=1 Tax=Polistes canadensis TaxID=91411 RepID=UPI000718AEB9|nr:PREDICTED: uncharacterized protein F13E9.13, mitochondrial isoform X2 [Polistes canadensis]